MKSLRKAVLLSELGRYGLEAPTPTAAPTLTGRWPGSGTEKIPPKDSDLDNDQFENKEEGGAWTESPVSFRAGLKVACPTCAQWSLHLFLLLDPNERLADREVGSAPRPARPARDSFSLAAEYIAGHPGGSLPSRERPQGSKSPSNARLTDSSSSRDEGEEVPGEKSSRDGSLVPKSTSLPGRVSGNCEVCLGFRAIRLRRRDPVVEVEVPVTWGSRARIPISDGTDAP